MKQSFYELTLDTIKGIYDFMKKARPYRVSFTYNYKGRYVDVFMYKEENGLLDYKVKKMYKMSYACPTEAKKELIVEIVTKLHKSIRGNQ